MTQASMLSVPLAVLLVACGAESPQVDVEVERKAPSFELAVDSVEVDPLHYQVEFENDQVRILRITYGPGEKSVMHEHPAAVAVLLTDQEGRFHLPDGTTEERTGKAGETRWNEAVTHLPENLSDQALEVVLVELKTTGD